MTTRGVKRRGVIFDCPQLGAFTLNYIHVVTGKTPRRCLCLYLFPQQQRHNNQIPGIVTCLRFFVFPGFHRNAVRFWKTHHNVTFREGRSLRREKTVRLSGLRMTAPQRVVDVLRTEPHRDIYLTTIFYHTTIRNREPPNHG